MLTFFQKPMFYLSINHRKNPKLEFNYDETLKTFENTQEMQKTNCLITRLMLLYLLNKTKKKHVLLFFFVALTLYHKTNEEA